MIFYKIELTYKAKAPDKLLGNAYKKNQWCIPGSQFVVVTYEVKQRSLEKALVKIAPRMKDTANLKFVKYRQLGRVKR